MSTLLNFIDSNKRQLVQIYVKERQTTGEDGLLWILETPYKQAKVSYMIMSELPEALIEEVDKLKKENNSDSIIYFYVCDPLMAQLIQIDLRQFNPETSQMSAPPPNVTVVEYTQNSD